MATHDMDQPENPGGGSGEEDGARDAGPRKAGTDVGPAGNGDDWTEDAGALIAGSPWTATLSALGLGLAAGILIGILIARD